MTLIGDQFRCEIHGVTQKLHSFSRIIVVHGLQ